MNLGSSNRNHPLCFCISIVNSLAWLGFFSKPPMHIIILSRESLIIVLQASTNGSSENTNGGVNTEDVTITDEKLDVETTSQAGSLASERGIDIGRVGSWATDFEKLLTDPIGLRTFAVRLLSKLVDTSILRNKVEVGCLS